MTLWMGRGGVATVALLLATACFSGRSRSGAPADPYRITTEELEASRFDNLYDAVRQMRPDWFRRASSTGTGPILVYLDDQQVGGVTALGRFTTRSVVEVRYLTPTEAQVRYGQSNYGRPAIQLLTSH